MEAGQARGGNRMGWDKGRYYTRSRKVNGRVVREYVGCGPIAAIAAGTDALEREQRKIDRDAFRLERAETDDLDARVSDLDELADLVTCAALLSAGYCQHNRGEWRKRRVQSDESR